MARIILEWEDGKVSRINGSPAGEASRSELIEAIDAMGQERAVALDMQARLIDNMVDSTHRQEIHDLLISIVDAVKTGALPVQKIGGMRAMKEHHQESFLAGLNEALDIVSKDKLISDPMDPGSTIAVDAHDINSARVAIRRAIKAAAGRPDVPAVGSLSINAELHRRHSRIILCAETAADAHRNRISGRMMDRYLDDIVKAIDDLRSYVAPHL